MFFSIAGVSLAGILFLLLYLQGGDSFPKPLTKEEEAHYLTLAAKGDKNAKNVLIERNLRLVAHIIKKFYSNESDKDDLLSIGTIGLIKAVNSFNPGKNVKLATYASRCIENEILMYFRGNKKTAGDISLNKEIETDHEDGSLSLIDVLADEDSILDTVDRKIKAERLYRYIKSELTPRERKIITLRYGLAGDAPLTQREAAAKLGISRSYVSRIEKKSLLKLRAKYESDEA